MNILSSIIILGGLGIVFGLLLGVAAKVFRVEVDERIPRIVEALPGANCGACGYAGCTAYANAVVEEGVKGNLCPVGGNKAAFAISEIMGVSSEEVDRKVARVFCAGSPDKVNFKFIYEGTPDCNSAHRLSGGPKGCSYGCLGFGSCADACDYDAIRIENGLAIIDEEKCVACGACVKECPRKIIKMVKEKARYAVLCNSYDKGKAVKSACKVGCIGCMICAKQCPKDAITVENSLASIDEDKCINCGICEKKCPQKTIVKLNAGTKK